MPEAPTNARPHHYLLFELTKKCQNDCIFCYNVWKEDDGYPQQEMSTAEALRVVEKVLGESECKYISLTGGEPLLHPGVFEIAACIAANGATPVLISNGKLLNERRVEAALRSGIKHFEVSLHSHRPEIHDRLVGRSGSFEEAIDAVVNVKKLGGEVNTVYVATTDSIGEFAEYVELNALLRVDWILFNRAACGGTCMQNWPAIAPAPQQVQRALDQGAELIERYRIGMSAGVQLQPCLIDLKRYENIASGFCPLNVKRSGQTYFAIDPAGNVRMCNRSKTILGNLLRDRFADIVSSRKVDDFCKAVPTFCRDCRLADECGGGCKADAMAYYGTLSEPDPYLVEHKDLVKKIK